MKLSFQVTTVVFSRLARLFREGLECPNLELVEVSATYMPGDDNKLEVSTLAGIDTIRVPTKKLCVSLLYDVANQIYARVTPKRHEVNAIVLPKFTVELDEGKEAKEYYELPHVYDHKDNE